MDRMIKGAIGWYWSLFTFNKYRMSHHLIFFFILPWMHFSVFFPPLLCYSLQLCCSPSVIPWGLFSLLPRCCFCSTLFRVLSTYAWIFHCAHSPCIYSCALSHWQTVWAHCRSRHSSVKRIVVMTHVYTESWLFIYRDVTKMTLIETLNLLSHWEESCQSVILFHCICFSCAFLWQNWWFEKSKSFILRRVHSPISVM